MADEAKKKEDALALLAKMNQAKADLHADRPSSKAPAPVPEVVESKEMEFDTPDKYPKLVAKHVEAGAGQEHRSWYIHVTVQMKPGGGQEQHNSIMHGMRFNSEEEADSEEAVKLFLERLKETKRVLKVI